MSERHHGIDYVELAAPDLEASRAFYEAAFGWEFTAYGPDYAGFRRPGDQRESGGLTREGAPGGSPLVILWSDDLDASLAAVRAAGGEIVTEPFDFPGGRRFHLADPSGTVLGVWTER